MARRRTGSTKKRSSAKAKAARAKAANAKAAKAKAAKARAAKAKAAKRSKAVERRRPAPRIKQRIGPVQLWLPLQMPLGLLGGVAVAPAPAPGIDDPPAAPTGAPGEQESLFE